MGWARLRPSCCLRAGKCSRLARDGAAVDWRQGWPTVQGVMQSQVGHTNGVHGISESARGVAASAGGGRAEP